VLVVLVTGGLLHGIPKNEDEKEVPKKIVAALRECVEETETGGRVKAVNSLSDVLTTFVRFAD